MAGDWLKFDKNTPDKPEVFEMAATLCIDPDAVVGKLMRVWSWFDSHTVDGNAPRVTPALLDRVAGAPGFVTAMQSVGWMVIGDEGCHLPKFDRHCGETSKKRALGKNRTEKSRSGSASSVTKSVTDGVTGASPEKRREDLKELPPVSPKGDQPAKPKGQTLKAWLDSLPDGAPAIPEDHHVFAYADRVGLPHDFVGLAWEWFQRKYLGDKPRTRQLDWPGKFRNAVEDRWGNLWWINHAGEFELTTAGQQLRRSIDAEAQERAA